MILSSNPRCADCGYPISAMHPNGDPPHRPFLLPGDDESHEQHPGESAGPARRKTRPQTAPPPTTHHQHQTTANEKVFCLV